MQKKEFYLTKNGSRHNKGTKESPYNVSFLSVFDQIRRDKVRGEIYDYTVKIQGGTYYLTSPVVIDRKCEARVKFTSLDNEPVIFSGGKIIDGFEDTVINGKPAVKTTIPMVKTGEWYFSELYVNKTPRFRPMYPESGYLRIAGLPGRSYKDERTMGNTYFTAKKGDLEHISNIEDCDVIATHYWIEERMPVESFDREALIVKSKKPSCMTLKDDIVDDFAKYKVENVFEELKKEGQWYLNRKSGELFYILMKGETKDNILVEAPVLKEILNIEADNIEFENIIFENTASYNTLKKAASGQAASMIEGAVKINASKFTAFENCVFRNLGNYAVEFNKSCLYSSVIGCEIVHCGAGGIKVMGADTDGDEKSCSGYITLKNNHIHNCTLVYYSAVGIFVRDGFSVNISGNEIHDMKYSGISVGWVWGYFKSRSCDNTISHNHIYNLGDGQMSDLGGIYLLGPQGGTVVSYNHIHNIKKANYGGEGIYLDEGTSNVIIEKNIVHHTASACFMAHWAKDNVIRYNIFAYGNNGIVCLSRNGDSYFMGTFTKNIYITDNNPIYQGEDKFNHEKDSMLSESNIIYEVNGNKVFNSFGKTTMERYIEKTWESWQNDGYDLTSFVGDIKINLDNFELSPDSPAYKLGFNNK